MTGGAFWLGGAQENVFNGGALNASTLKRVFDGVASHRDAVGVIERTAACFTHARPGGGNDYSFTHLVFLQKFLQRYSVVAAHTNGLTPQAPAFP